MSARQSRFVALQARVLVVVDTDSAASTGRRIAAVRHHAWGVPALYSVARRIPLGAVALPALFDLRPWAPVVTPLLDEDQALVDVAGDR